MDNPTSNSHPLQNNTTTPLASEYPPSTLEETPFSVSKCPAPAGQTPPPPGAREHHLAAAPFIPSPIECASPTSGNMYHPATPMPVGNPAFHNTPASPPVPSFQVNSSAPAGAASPMLCGPTPTSTPVHPSLGVPRSPLPSTMEFASETYATPLPSTTTTTNASPITTTAQSPSTHAPHLSTLKGNFTSFVGKVTHNPDKQQAGNAMIATRKEEKATFFEQKATEWELKGNTSKATKNREKAARYRQTAQARLNAPLTTPANKTPAKMDKAARLDAKAQEYERRGDETRAVKCHAKAYQLRQKYGFSDPVGGTTPTVAAVGTPYTVAPIVQV